MSLLTKLLSVAVPAVGVNADHGRSYHRHVLGEQTVLLSVGVLDTLFERGNTPVLPIDVGNDSVAHCACSQLGRPKSIVRERLTHA